jgi:pimeloyl-ACP methyl ester carboxylesterase
VLVPGQGLRCPFPDRLSQIAIAIAALRAAGVHGIVVAGQRMGGLAAIIYGAQHPDLAGVIALASWRAFLKAPRPSPRRAR